MHPAGASLIAFVLRCNFGSSVRTEPSNLRNHTLSALRLPAGRWAVLYAFVHLVKFGLLSPAHFTFKMVVTPEVQAMYNLYGFVPQSMMDAWSESGFMIGSVLEWLSIPVNLARALLTSLGTEWGHHVSELAHVSIEDYENIISAPELMRNPINHTSAPR